MSDADELHDFPEFDAEPVEAAEPSADDAFVSCREALATLARVLGRRGGISLVYTRHESAQVETATVTMACGCYARLVSEAGAEPRYEHHGRVTGCSTHNVLSTEGLEVPF